MPAMTKPEISSARGIVRRGSRISPASTGASSNPAKAKQICEKKMIVSRFENVGASDDTGIGVAEPSATSATRPTPISTSEGSHCARPPRFCSQRPVPVPTMLKPSATPSRIRDAPAAKVCECSSPANWLLKMYRANTAVLRHRVGKYKMFDAQYSQPAMKPWRSPKASLIHTYRPPSFGSADDSVITHRPCGMKNASAASSHNVSEEGPECPASATQRRPTMATVLNSTRSSRPSDLFAVIGDPVVSSRAD